MVEPPKFPAGLHPLEWFGLAGLVVGGVVSLASWAGPVMAILAAIPLFVGQHLRHKQTMAALEEWKRRLWRGK